MVRYMFWMSYMGSRFAGSQCQKNLVTPQHVFQNALALVLQVPSQLIVSRMASRTDAGVHALRTALTVTLKERMRRNNLAFDLKFRNDESYPYNPDDLLSAVNHVLKDMNFDVRLLGCRQVAYGFCPRKHAQSRTYLYRLLILKPEFDNDPGRHRLMRDPMAFAPLLEKDRSWAVASNFNFEQFEKAAKIFEGLHDFRSFSGAQVLKSVRPRRDQLDLEPPSTFRSVKLVEVLRGSPLIDPRYEPLAGCFEYVDVLIHAKSFIYRQIRKMMGAMVGVAQNKATCDDIKWLLENPDFEYFSKYDFEIAPAGGLYLTNIVYDPKDFDNPSVIYAEDEKNLENENKENEDDEEEEEDDEESEEIIKN